MAGTIKGGKKAAATNRSKYGLEFYRQIGAKGGEKSRGGGFTDPETAKRAGRIGGTVSRRRPKESYPDTRILTARVERKAMLRDERGRFTSAPRQDWGLSSPESRAALAELAPYQSDVDVIPNIHYFVWIGASLLFGFTMLLLGAHFF